MSILISGSLVYDHIMNFPDSFKNHIMPDQIHILNVGFIINKLQKSWGGTAGNIAYTVKLLGAEPIIVSAVGNDAGEYQEHFKQCGISTEFILIDHNTPTASAYITTDNEDNQISAFYGGPLDSTPDLPETLTRQTTPLALISPTDKEVMIKHLRQAKEKKMTAIFDPGQQLSAFSGTELKSLISQSDMVIANDYEIKLLQKKTGWDAKKMLAESKRLVTTLGEAGSTISTDQGEMIKVKACPPKFLEDPTGSGDAYRAGFFVGYEKNFDLKTCAQIGSVAASYAIEVYGTQEHHFTMDEFNARYKNTYASELILSAKI